jgi:hypothetical protein
VSSTGSGGGAAGFRWLCFVHFRCALAQTPTPSFQKGDKPTPTSRFFPKWNLIYSLSFKKHIILIPLCKFTSAFKSSVKNLFSLRAYFIFNLQTELCRNSEIPFYFDRGRDSFKS